ncbi:MAG: HNH endonuclease [Oscillospiraceae bacterium]|nr:HNH endonuclease [Oscillospiraceae bacterium]
MRQCNDDDKRAAYEQQQGICPICSKHFYFDKMHVDHITPWHAGGKTIPENLQMLCRDCNLKKSGQE